jgi:hypothetical protein
VALNDQEQHDLTVQGEQIKYLVKSVDNLSEQFRILSDAYHARDIVVDRHDQQLAGWGKFGWAVGLLALGSFGGVVVLLIKMAFKG